jgi:hypothetical protein
MGILKLIFSCIKERKMPQFLWKHCDGTVLGKCPRCKASVAYSKIEVGEQAFKCLACGEEGTWKAPT